MNLDEAIKLLKEDICFLQTEDGRKLEEAQQLGIEALEDLVEFRKKFPNTPLLPSEIEEE